jgi:peptide/nickel transport system substrate-binding protein
MFRSNPLHDQPRHSLLRIAAFVVVVLMLAGCQSATSPQTTTPSVLRVGLVGYPESFNFNLDANSAGFSLYRAMYNRLTFADSTKGGTLGPELATSWQLLDPTTWQFKLRQDVKWSDGTRFTADDVVATIDLTVNGQPAAVMLSRIRGVIKGVAIDQFTVNVSTETPNAILPLGFADLYMYQAKQIKDGGNAAIQKNPVVTGMYKLKSREAGVSIVLERNPEYWGEKPKLTELVFKPFPENATRVAALEAGEIDIAFNVPPDDARRLESKGLAIQSVAIGQSMVVPMRSFDPKDPKSPFLDKRVRQALNYGVDKDAIVKDVMLGFGQKLRGQIVGPDGFGFNESLNAYPYDPTKAKQLLTDAGYPTGFAVTFYSSEGRYAKQKEVTEAIAGQLRKLGLNVTVNTQEFNTMFNQVAAAQLDFYFIGWNYYPQMDADFASQHFACISRYKQMCNKTYDELFVKERAEPDPQKRVALLRQMQQILYDEAPAIFLYQSPDIFGAQKRVKGFRPTPDDVIHFGSISVEAP